MIALERPDPFSGDAIGPSRGASCVVKPAGYQTFGRGRRLRSPPRHISFARMASPRSHGAKPSQRVELLPALIVECSDYFKSGRRATCIMKSMASRDRQNLNPAQGPTKPQLAVELSAEKFPLIEAIEWQLRGYVRSIWLEASSEGSGHSCPAKAQLSSC